MPKPTGFSTINGYSSSNGCSRSRLDRSKWHEQREKQIKLDEQKKEEERAKREIAKLKAIQEEEAEREQQLPLHERQEKIKRVLATKLLFGSYAVKLVDVKVLAGDTVETHSVGDIVYSVWPNDGTMYWGKISHASQDPAQYDVNFDDGDQCMQIGASCVFSQKWAMANIPNCPARVQPKTDEGEIADNNNADDDDDKSTGTGTGTAIASIVGDHEDEKDKDDDDEDSFPPPQDDEDEDEDDEDEDEKDKDDGDEDFFPPCEDEEDEDDEDEELIASHAKADAKGDSDADTEEETSPEAGGTSKAASADTEEETSPEAGGTSKAASASASASIATKPHRSDFDSNSEYLSSLFGGTGKKAGPKPAPEQLGKRAPKAGKRLVGTHPGSNKQLIDDSTRKQFKLSLKHDHKLMPMMTPISKADGFNPAPGKYTIEELEEVCIELIASLAVSLCSCLHIFIT